jgi:hypothetical protein
MHLGTDVAATSWSWKTVVPCGEARLWTDVLTRNLSEVTEFQDSCIAFVLIAQNPLSAAVAKSASFECAV